MQAVLLQLLQLLLLLLLLLLRLLVPPLVREGVTGLRGD